MAGFSAFSRDWPVFAAIDRASVPAGLARPGSGAIRNTLLTFALHQSLFDVE